MHGAWQSTKMPWSAVWKFGDVLEKVKVIFREKDRKKVGKSVQQLVVTVNEMQCTLKDICVYRNRVALMC